MRPYYINLSSYLWNNPRRSGLFEYFLRKYLISLDTNKPSNSDGRGKNNLDNIGYQAIETFICYETSPDEKHSINLKFALQVNTSFEHTDGSTIHQAAISLHAAEDGWLLTTWTSRNFKTSIFFWRKVCSREGDCKFWHLYFVYVYHRKNPASNVQVWHLNLYTCVTEELTNILYNFFKNSVFNRVITSLTLY